MEVEWPDDLLSIGDLTGVALEALLDLAAAMKDPSSDWSGALAGETVACFFDPPTTGMTISAGAAAERLGMLPVMLPCDELRVGSGEPVEDIARTLSASAAALMAHTVADRTLRRVAAGATVPVINARSDEHRPCQVLADLLTLREHFGDLSGLVVAFVGDATDGIAHSLMEAGGLTGMDLRIACPPDRGPSRLIQVGAETFAAMHDGRVTVTAEPSEAADGADAIYTAAWPSVRPGEDAAGRWARMGRYQVNPGLMRHAKPRAVFMHCLPARRGEEVASVVMDGARSVVWEQAANRVPAEQAAIHALVGARARPAAG
jgi:ornithine carbamoyltransferase